MKRIQFSKFGLAENPVGFHVSLPWKSRTLLGEVKEVKYIHERGVFQLAVHHFNGEEWPVRPIASAVEVFGRP